MTSVRTHCATRSSKGRSLLKMARACFPTALGWASSSTPPPSAVSARLRSLWASNVNDSDCGRRCRLWYAFPTALIADYDEVRDHALTIEDRITPFAPVRAPSGRDRLRLRHCRTLCTRCTLRREPDARRVGSLGAR